MKRIILIIILIFLLVIDNTILPYYSIKSGYPSLLFVFALAYSIINGKYEAAFIGILTGFLQDIFFTGQFGTNMLLNLLLCILAAKIGEGIFKEKRLIPIISTFVISALKVLGVSVIFYISNLKVDLLMAFISVAMNTGLMFFVYKIVLTTSQKYKTKDRWRYK